MQGQLLSVIRQIFLQQGGCIQAVRTFAFALAAVETFCDQLHSLLMRFIHIDVGRRTADQEGHAGTVVDFDTHRTWHAVTAAAAEAAGQLAALLFDEGSHFIVDGRRLSSAFQELIQFLPSSVHPRLAARCRTGR